MIEASSTSTTRREGTTQMTTQPIRWTRPLATLVATGLLAVPTFAAHAAGGPVLVESIDIRGSGDVREVVVRTSNKPTFSVFRLAEPFRVLLDIDNAKMAKPVDLMKVDDGLVRYVATTQFNDQASAILRVEIALDQTVPYSARSDGRSVVLTIGSEKPLPPERAAAVTGQDRDKLSDVTTPTRRTKSGRVKLGKFARRMRSKLAILRTEVAKKSKGLDPDAFVEQVSVETIDGPRRIVVDIPGAVMKPKWQRVKVDRNGVKTARFADKGGSVRCVLDVAQDAPAPKVRVRFDRGNFEVAIASPKNATAQRRSSSKATAQHPSPAVGAAPQAGPAAAMASAQAARSPAATPAASAQAARSPAATPAQAPQAVMIRDVRFEPKDGFVRLTLKLSDAEARVHADGAKGAAPTLRLMGAQLPPALERTLDVTEVAPGVVSSISTYNEAGTAMVLANIRPGTEHRHWRKGNKLMWDFRNRGVTTTRQLAYDERSTTGYQASAAAAQAIGRATPAQRTRRYTGRRITLDLKDADIQNVLRLLADVSKLNIVAADDVRGKVTIKLRNVPWDQALDIILRTKQLDKVRNGNIIRVAPITVLQEEEALRVKRAKSRVQLEPLSVRLIPVSYAVASEVAPQVEALLSERGKVNIDKRTNVLVVEDIQEVLVKVERLVRTLDTQTPQVLIEARIVEARSNFSRQLGIQWGGSFIASQATGNSTGLSFPNLVRVAGGADDQTAPVTNGINPTPNYAVNLPAAVGSGAGGALGFTLGSIGGSALVSIRLSAAEAEGRVKIISAPKVVTLDNAEANIISGERVPITVITANGPTTRFIDANLALRVTPHVTQDGSILMQISATKNELSDRTDNLGVPGIVTKEAQTEMIVRDGDTAVLGGIYRRTATENENYVPWLGKIPVLGWLFKNRSTSDARDELLIFISPRIVNRSAALVNTN